MNKQIKVKILSIIVCLLVVLVLLTLDTLICNSIIISHYGGLSSIYSPYLLSLAISMAVGIVWFVNAILSVTNVKSPVIKLFLTFTLASVSCFIFLVVAWRLQVGVYGNEISDIFNQHIYYIFVAAFVIQFLFLEKYLIKWGSDSTIQKSILGVIVFQIVIFLFAFILNIGSIREGYERRHKEPNYMQGNSRIFRVVLNEKCGLLPPIVDGKIIVEFPENGLVILQANENDIHISDCKFYYINKHSKRQELYLVDIWNEEKDVVDEYERQNNVKGMIYGGINHMPFSTDIGTYTSGTPSAISYWDFFVHATHFSYEKKRATEMEFLTRRSVKECREL